MPFEPRLFHGDCDPRPLGSDCAIESDADLGLPVELTALADQLRTEAGVLAECYPAAPAADFHAKPANSVQSWAIWGGIAAAALLGALLGWHSVAGPAPSKNKPAADDSAVATASDTGGQLAAAPSDDAWRAAPARSVDPAVIRATQGIAEVSVAPPPAPRKPPADEVGMLRVQVDGFEKLIHRLQAELAARDAQQAEAQRQIESLRQEVRQLQKQLDAQPHK